MLPSRIAAYKSISISALDDEQSRALINAPLRIITQRIVSLGQLLKPRTISAWNVWVCLFRQLKIRRLLSANSTELPKPFLFSLRKTCS